MTQARSIRAADARISDATRARLPYFLIVAVYAGLILLVNPRGEFPLNDDWCYARSAFRLGLENRLVVDEFSAPNLVGQAFYGGLLINLFGGSFLILRLSTLALSCGLACMLWKCLSELGISPGITWLAVLCWIFNPVQFCLSFTYMTEIPFLFMIAASGLAFARYLATRRIRPLLLCGALLGYAFLIRQTAALFMLPIALCLLVEGAGRGFRQMVARLAAWMAAVGIFVAGFYLWAHSHGSSTPAARRKFELLRHLTAEQIQGNLFGLLFYLSFFLLPLLAFIAPGVRTMLLQSGKVRGVFILFGWTLLSAAGVWWFHARYSGGTYLPGRAFHGQMPFLLNILFDTGLGPLTLDPTYYGAPPTPMHPRAWQVVTWLVAAGLVVLGTVLTIGAAGFRKLLGRTEQRIFALFCSTSLVVVALFEVIFSHIQEGGLFDRHILTAALPVTFLVCLVADGRRRAGAEQESRSAGEQSRPVPAGRSACTVLAALMLGILAWFCITATHDYLAWNRLRWDLGADLLARKVDPLTVSGGFEFNGWNNYDTFRVRGNIEKIYYWWYDRPDYVIVLEPQEEYRVVKRLEYYSWLHRKNLPVYLLQKN